MLDTNVIIYSLKAGLELPEAIYYTSEITKKEILSFKKIGTQERAYIEDILNQIDIVPVNDTVKSNALKIQKKYKLSLPDSIICALTYSKKLTLITNDHLLHQVKEIKSESFYFVDN
jgi:predicted nucleic acid-binding protein